MKKFNLATAFTAALLVSLAPSAKALFLIDDFSAPNINLSTSSTADLKTNFLQNPAMFMGSRITTLYKSSASGPGSSNLTINNGLSVSSSPGVETYVLMSYGIVRYDEATGTQWISNANNVNLYHLTELQFEVASASSGTRIYIDIISGFSTTTSYRIDILNEVVTPTIFKTNLLDPLSGNHAIRFDTDRVRIDIGTAQGGHINLNRVQAVPEPGTMLALGAGLAALTARRKRKA